MNSGNADVGEPGHAVAKATATTAASSATNRSLVPAVTIKIVPRPFAARGGIGGEVHGTGQPVHLATGNSASSAVTASSLARVARKLP